MSDRQTPLYVRLSADQTQRLERAVSASGRSKRALVEDAVREHVGDDGMVVGRIALREQLPDVLTLGEAAELLRIEPEPLAAAAAAGELPGRAIGAEWRFSRAALMRWLEAQ